MTSNLAAFCDWNCHYSSDEALKADLGELDLKEGWHVKGKDVLLLISTKSVKGWNVYVWNGVDPREDLKRVLALSETRY